jgi:C1A family cysteine protease
MNKLNKVKFGWCPDTPDVRDYRYTASRSTIKKMPSKVDLEQNSPAIRDQKYLGSCTGFGLRTLYGFTSRRQGKLFDPSPLFIYYNERLVEGTVNCDCGAEIRTGIKTINEFGVCSESKWPYHVRKWKTKPYVSAYKEALEHQSLIYQRVDNTDIRQIKARLSEGFPIVFGFAVYSNFGEIKKDGIMPLPSQRDYLVGGHAVVAIGYFDKTERIKVRNSWGRNWGDSGDFYMPYDYISNNYLADDFWTIDLVEHN